MNEDVDARRLVGHFAIALRNHREQLRFDHQPVPRDLELVAALFLDWARNGIPSQPEAHVEPPAALTVPQAARRLALSEKTVWRRIRNGDIASIKTGRSRRIPASAVDAFLSREERG